MFTNTINLLKKNPLLILLYLGYTLVSLIVFFILMPIEFNQADPLSALVLLGKILFATLIVFALYLFFFPGYGHMISEALEHGKTSIQSFLPGTKKFFVRILVTTLLFSVFYMGLSTIICMIIIPIVILTTVSSADPNGFIAFIPLITMIIVFIIIIFSIPFVLLWYPAVFIDDIDSIEGLKRGFRAAVKSYWKLFLATLILFIPPAIYLIIEYPFNSTGTLTYGPAYFIMLIVTSLLSIVYLPYLFVSYKKVRSQFTNITS